MPFLSKTGNFNTGQRGKRRFPITNGLVIQLDAHNSASYPGTGTSVYDLTSGFTHTLTDGATFTTLNGVKTFDCTSASRRILCNGTGPTLPTSGYTYITWARIISSSAAWRTLLRSLPNDHPLLVQVNTDNLGFFDNDGAAAFIDSTYDITPIKDTWAQYAIVADNASTIFYINGTQVGSIAYGAGGNTHNAWGGWPNQPFGYVANLFYYNRKLTLAEIQQQYNFLVPRFT